MAKKVIIVGGGVIGYCSAYYLMQAGHEVTIVEKSESRDGCSYGNAGMIVPSHIVPLASPGIIKSGLKWLLKSDSPFYIKPRLNLDLIKWCWIFYQNANSSHVKRFAPILASLNNRSVDLYNDINSDLEEDLSYRNKGLLMLYQSAKTEKEELETAEFANQVGIETQVLTNDGLTDLDPGTRYNVRGAIHYPGDAFLDPERFMVSLETKLIQSGVTICRGSGINSFEYSNGRIIKAFSDDENYLGEEFVISAGIYSSAMAKHLGCYLPMQGGKGYSITLEKPESLPEICSILVESRVAVTPMNGNLRLAGTMEIAGLDLSISENRVNGYLKSVEDYLPQFPYSEMRYDNVWSGLRPCSPDGIPYIGRTQKFSNLIFATGHAMMGLSLGPISGKIVSDIISEKEVFPDINQLSPDRFN